MVSCVGPSVDGNKTTLTQLGLYSYVNGCVCVFPMCLCVLGLHSIGAAQSEVSLQVEGQVGQFSEHHEMFHSIRLRSRYHFA
jgi:hypothetical protein